MFTQGAFSGEPRSTVQAWFCAVSEKASKVTKTSDTFIGVAQVLALAWAFSPAKMAARKAGRESIPMSSPVMRRQTA